MSERGGIISAYLLKVVLTLAIVGGGLYEVGAVIFSKVQADSIALECAAKAAEDYARSGSTEKATAIARDLAERRGGELTTLEVVPERSEVTVTVSVRAKTYVLHRIGALREHTVASSTHSSRVV